MARARPYHAATRIPASGTDSAEAVVAALSAALEARDGYTSEHLTATIPLARRVGARLGLEATALAELGQIAALHDVGKLGIPTDIIRKQGPLNEQEWSIMREHSAIGAQILERVPDLRDVARAVRHGHERWDGGGYPDRLAGDEIPLASRIILVCDAYDAMTSDRPYRPAMGTRRAIAELRDGAGTQFDPRVAQTLLALLGESALPIRRPPHEVGEQAQAEEFGAIAAQLGASDLFVLRRTAARRYAHLAGFGQGARWAGAIELDAASEPHLRAAVAGRRPHHVSLGAAGRVIGPYYAGSAVLVPCTGESVVVFGAVGSELDGCPSELAAELAARATELVRDVSPIKRLADDPLEVLDAMRDVTGIAAEDLTATLTAIACRSASALSARFAAAMIFASDDHQGAIGWWDRGWQPDREELLVDAMLSFAARSQRAPFVCQDTTDVDGLPPGFGREDGVSAVHARLIGAPPAGALLVVHTLPDLRGFTALCQRVSRGIADAADAVVRRALARERLAAERRRQAERAEHDELSGLARLTDWDDILAAEELHRGRSGATSLLVVIAVERSEHADGLLRRIAAVVMETTRATDVVARIEAGEIGVLLRYTDAADGAEWCDRLRSRLRSLELRSARGAAPRFRLGCAAASGEITIADALAAARMRARAQDRAR